MRSLNPMFEFILERATHYNNISRVLFDVKLYITGCDSEISPREQGKTSTKVCSNMKKFYNSLFLLFCNNHFVHVTGNYRLWTKNRVVIIVIWKAHIVAGVYRNKTTVELLFPFFENSFHRIVDLGSVSVYDPFEVFHLLRGTL